jgi:hypothetical protein
MSSFGVSFPVAMGSSSTAPARMIKERTPSRGPLRSPPERGYSWLPVIAGVSVLVAASRLFSNLGMERTAVWAPMPQSRPPDRPLAGHIQLIQVVIKQLEGTIILGRLLVSDDHSRYHASMMHKYLHRARWRYWWCCGHCHHWRRGIPPPAQAPSSQAHRWRTG